MKVYKITNTTLERWKRCASADCFGGIHGILWKDIEAFRAKGGDLP